MALEAKLRTLSLFLLALTIAPASAVGAEPDVGAGSMGLSFDLGGLALAGAPTAVSLSYFQSDQSAWQGTFGLDSATEELVLAAALRTYLSTGEARGFWQVGGALGVDTSDDLLIAATGALGVEYWLTEHLSLWGITGLSLILDDDFRAVTGSSSLNASIYF